MESPTSELTAVVTKQEDEFLKQLPDYVELSTDITDNWAVRCGKIGNITIWWSMYE